MLTRCSSFRPRRTSLTLLLLCLLALLPAGARAATYLVTDLNDYNPNTTTYNTDTGSLRYAVSQASQAAYTSGLPSVVLFQNGLSGTIHLAATLDVLGGVVINGPGGGQIKLDGGASGGNTFPDIEISLGAQGSTAAISGVTIQNGQNNGSSPLEIQDTNLADGGGIYVGNGAALSLSNCILTGNTAANGLQNDGGALYGATGSTVTATNCTFTNNTAASTGGAVACGVDTEGSGATTLTLTGCTFTGNTSSGYGGGAVSVYGGSGTLTNCTFTGNTGSTASGGYGIGGALYAGFGSAAMTGCTFAYNTGGAGGAVGGAGPISMTNCLLVGNSAGQGGAVVTQGGSLTITGSTLTQNTATTTGGYAGGGISGGATLTNDIIYGNTDGSGSPNDVESDYGGTETNCDVDANDGAAYQGTTAGKVTQPPMFVSPASSQSALGDFHLLPGSPCIGAGVTQANAPTGVTLPTTDLDGDPRPASLTAPTIGAYEGDELIVNTAADPDNNIGGNGTTLSLREAVNQANAATSFVRIIFDPTAFAAAQTITEGSSLGTMKLSGTMTIQGPVNGVSVNGSNANTVLEISGGTSAAPITLANLTIENGNNTGAVNNGVGGGVSVDAQAEASLIDCTLSNNSANADYTTNVSDVYGSGGGVGSAGGGMTLMNCDFIGNSAFFGGGGLAYNVYETSGTVSLTNCTFANNSAPNTVAGTGGAIFNYGSTMTAAGCTFMGNSARDGGGIYNEPLIGNGGFSEENTSVLHLTNCLFSGNTATDTQANFTGGGLSSSDTTTITNCTFTENHAPFGGGATIGLTGSATLINDIFYADSVTLDNSGDKEVNTAGGGTVTATHCDIAQPLGAEANGGSVTDNGGNINVDPQFFNTPTDLHLNPASPCVGAGTATGAPATDITGLLRPVPPSIGAYEVAAVVATTAPTTTATTTTQVSDTPNPSAPGQNVTFTVQVAPTSGTGTPTGTVAFSVNGASTSEPLAGNGQAAFSTTTLPAGMDTVTATYSGDSNFSGSSVTFTQNVLQATTTNVTASPASSTQGQSVTFTATVAPTPASGESVTFTANGVTTSELLNSSGEATFTTTTLPAGQNTVTATYSGDSALAPSSGTATETVASSGGGGGGTTTPTTLHTFTAGLQMISLTENYNGVSPLSDAWSAPSGQTLFEWQGGPNYVTDSVTAASGLPAPGVGAWLYVASGQSIAVYDTGQAIFASNLTTISLTTGWNLIGDPFDGTVLLSGVTVSASGGASYSLPLGNLQGLVFPTLYTYPAAALGSSQPYQTVDATQTGSSLSAFAGYWIYAFQPCTLSVPAPSGR